MRSRFSYPRDLALIKRRRRLQDPEHEDNGSYQLIKLMGWPWWVRHGFKRELIVERGRDKAPVMIDMANPKIMLAIEADGQQYHTDVLYEEWRERFLSRRGWYVLHFRWVDLVHHADECLEDIEDAWEALSDAGIGHREQRIDALRSAQRERYRERHFDV